MKKILVLLICIFTAASDLYSQCGSPAGASATAGATAVSISWPPVPGATSYTVTLGGRTIVVSGTSASFTGLPGGTTFTFSITASCGPGNSGFPFFGGVTTLPTCPFNFEPNNSPGESFAMPVNSFLTGGITPASDLDFYRFTLTDPMNISISLSTLPLNYDLSLLTSSNNVIASSTNTGTAAESITFNNLAPGTYHIRINGVNGAFSATACYTLLLTGTVTCGEAFEPNETAAAAIQISTQLPTKGSILSLGDVDWFKFSTSDDNDMTVTLSNLDSNFDMKLYNSSLVEIGSSVNTGNAAESITVNNQPPGTYYVQVFANNTFDTRKCYQLGFNLVKACNNKPEPNETLGAASWIDMPSALQSTIANQDDIDWYRVLSINNKSVNISLTQLPADYDLEVYNFSGSLLGSSTNWGTQNETVNITEKLFGPLFIKVFGKKGAFSQKCYRLAVSEFNGPEGGLTGGFNFGAAPLETVGKAQSQTGPAAGQSGALRVNAYPNPALNRLTVELNSGSSEKILLSLVSQAGIVVMQQELQLPEGSANFQLKQGNLPGGLYLLRVRQGNKTATQKIVFQ